jgi:phospholipase C
MPVNSVRATSNFRLLGLATYLAIALSGCGGSAEHTPQPSQFTLTVSPTGSGTVTSAPAGINCGTTCSATFPAGTSITLTASPAASNTFSGWSGACSGTAKCTVVLNADTNVGAAFSGPLSLAVSVAGPGTGVITSTPAGINCGQTCSSTFKAGTSVTLNAVPAANSTFAGWSGACSGTAACTIKGANAVAVTATFKLNGSLNAINHIVFMLQENRSFDHYFGALRQYWADNNYPDQPFDGLPQFPITAPTGPAPTNPGCDPAFPWNPNAPVDCTINANSPPVPSYHLVTQCLENPSPSWNESHVDFNLTDHVSGTATLDGFLWTAAHDARNQVPAFFDTNGVRAMGYYDGNDLNYYYFMASNFATSDRWFSPVMSRTPPNRMYLLAGTSHGHAYDLNKSGSPQLPDPIIFRLLQQHGISWKIYVHPDGSGCTTPQCLYKQSYVQNFLYGNTILQQFPQNILPISQYLTDVQSGTLPQVAMIEPASLVSLDEHPSDLDVPNPPNIQKGAQYVQSLIDALMLSPSWKDSAFILTFDEFGGFYDHVPPQPAVSPDGIPPSDLQPGDVCTNSTGPTCDFTYTGYRVPLIVVSPFAKKNYVSHTVADYTAILKFIEARFNLPPLTNRDAAQIDMTEFFDLVNMPWQIPPVPPQQNTNGACYLDHLP